MQRPRHHHFLLMAAMFLVAVSASAAHGFGPVGAVPQTAAIAVTDGPAASSGPGGTQCFPWKIGDRNQSGTTWVASNDSFIYAGVGVQFNPSKNTAPTDLTAGPDLSGIIGVGFTNPNFIPRRIDVIYSFLPVDRTPNTPSPAPATIGLTWFNDYQPGNTDPTVDQTVSTYPVFGQLTYTTFLAPLNNNTRYLVYVNTGDNGNHGGASGNSYALSGVLCFSH